MARIVLALLCACAAGLANPWSVDIGPPDPWAWQRLAAASDGQGGAWVAASAGSPASLYITHVGDDGTVQFGPSLIAAGYEQQPLLAAPDGQGGALLLVEEFTSWPPLSNQLRLVNVGNDGSVRWSALACTTQAGASCLKPQLAVGAQSALVGWAYQTTAGTEARVRRVQLDGTCVGEPLGEALCQAYSLGMVASGDSFVVAAADSTFIVKGGSSRIGWLGGQALSDPCVVHVTDVAADIVGFHSGAVWIDHRGAGGADTVATGLVQPVELQVDDLDGSCLISYRRDGNIYGRWFNPLTATVGEEITICGATGSQLGHQLSRGSAGIGAAWVDRRFGSDDGRVFCQHVWASGTRWPDGIELGSATPFGGTVPLVTCDGDSAGIAAWVLPSGSLRVAPIDSPWTDAASERPTPLPLQLSLVAYPNPFNASTTIRFDLPTFGQARVDVYDTRGRLVQRLADEPLPAGTHEVHWAPSVASGTYFIRITTAVGQFVRPVQLVR